ncbi:MAG TPA: EAL domain-containing protein [Burkholderiales bacterium]
MLKLLRYSQLLALAGMLLLVAALSLLYRGLVFDSLVEGETRSNVALTKSFANAIWPAHAHFVARAAALPPAELAASENIRYLAHDLRQLTRGLSVVKVKVYDLRGLTVFSTDPKQIGEDKSANPGFRRALGGAAASEITHRDRFDAWEGTLSDRDIIATYVPVRMADGAPVEAVLEIYSDVTELVARMQRGQWQILAGVLAAMGLVYLVVQFVLRRYRMLLRAQEEERAAQEERIRYQAYHDPLTQLPNRARFAESLSEALKRAKRAEWQLALLFVDLDNFKRVNDSLGHDAGDRLLQLAAGRIRSSVREADMLFRMGGDEFTVLLEDVRGPEEAAHVAQRMLDAMHEPVQLRHHELSVSASIGIALYPRDDHDGERLLKSADTAMYRAKELGRNRHAFFAPEMNRQMEQQMMMEAALRRAQKQGEFRVYYQPRISAATGRAIGAEALLRWHHPEWGVVEPASFVPLLEESGLIVPVGAWVLAEACRQARAWRDGGTPLRVSVNLSSRQFRSDDLIGAVDRALRESGLAPQLLELELTESLLIEDVQRAMGVMTRLKALGVAISIDDFGTGYSSLGYLQRFPIDCLKIDRGFVRDLAHSEKSAAIVDAISALARSLGLGLVAEGVEEPAQVDLLLARQCDEMQGFLYSAALPAEQLTGMLSRPLRPASRAARSSASARSA